MRCTVSTPRPDKNISFIGADSTVKTAIRQGLLRTEYGAYTTKGQTFRKVREWGWGLAKPKNKKKVKAIAQPPMLSFR